MLLKIVIEMEKQILKMDLKNPLYNYISQFNSMRVNNMVNSQLVDTNDYYHFTHFLK